MPIDTVQAGKFSIRMNRQQQEKERRFVFNFASILYCAILYYIILYCTILYYNRLYCTVLYYTFEGKESRKSLAASCSAMHSV
jgi:hypothetical protein